jgi:hypothetical protein
MSLMSDAADFFRSRLDQMIDARHPLAVLSSCKRRGLGNRGMAIRASDWVLFTRLGI